MSRSPFLPFRAVTSFPRVFLAYSKPRRVSDNPFFPRLAVIFAFVAISCHCLDLLVAIPRRCCLFELFRNNGLISK
jgi:hypothetical protein